MGLKGLWFTTFSFQFQIYDIFKSFDSIMLYGTAFYHLMITFSFVYYTSINAICQDGEIALGLVKTCFSPDDIPSCDKYMNPEAAAILTNDFSLIDMSSGDDLCGGGWTPLTGEVVCDDQIPIFIKTPGAAFGGCYPFHTIDEIYRYPPPSITKPFVYSIKYCCRRLHNKV